MLDPLNATGDREGSKLLADGTVKTPAGFKPAYRQFAENGWNGLTKPVEYGGQNLPQLVATPVEEMWHAANMAFDLCPLLTQGAIDAIELCGTPEQKAKFLPSMVSGAWTGTMNLTEPQAGSDLAAVRTRAVPQGDGTYKLFGQKIFITFGEHDFTDNIIHLVLARTPTAPEGVKGISLFLVPKFLINADGSLGARNDVHCVSLEHKLGIHASPTAVLAYGDNGGATGYLIGEENRGLEYMFIMMNQARFSVGMEGVGLSERAYQRAVAYARDRVQGKAPGAEKAAKAGPIIDHPDIRRMLMTMRAYTEAMRAVGYVTAAAVDNARHAPDAATRAQHQAFVDLMIPIVKGWCTETAQEVTSLGVQVHGGMGYIEETGAAQHYRDARIITIYEGTTGIQANDLIGRKTARDGGATARLVAAQIDKVVRASRVAGRFRAERDRPAARGGNSVAAVGDRLGGADVCDAAAHRARRVGAVPQAVGIGRRRLAARPLGEDRRRPAASGRRRSSVHARQDRHRALLCGVPVAAGRCASRNRSSTAAPPRWRCPPISSDGRRRNRRRAPASTPAGRTWAPTATGTACRT